MTSRAEPPSAGSDTPESRRGTCPQPDMTDMDTSRSASSPRDLAPYGPRPYDPASARPTGANAIELDRVRELRRINFLHHVGDYAGRLHNCLKKAAEAVNSHLPRRVADLASDLAYQARISALPTGP